MPSSHKRFFWGKTTLLPSKYYWKGLYKELCFFNYAITFSQVQTDISINYCFCFCFYSFDKKNKSLYYAKASLVDLKSREREHIVLEIPWNLSSFGRRNSINQLDHWISLGNALVKITIKGHNAFRKSKPGSNLLSSSHDLSSKYAYNACKPKAKFWLLPSLLVDANTNYVFFKRE